jgi:hypothetical protein
MAVYTTFFAATAIELEAAFGGWMKPLSKPVKRTSINPFTKQPVTYDSWEPEEASAPAPPVARPVVVAMRGDYQTYLRSRLPSGLQALPKLAVKGVLSTHVEQLLALVAKRAEERLLPALFPPGGSAATGKTLDVLPGWGVEALASLRTDALSPLGEALATAEGWFADEGWTEKDCTGLLGELRDLAVKAVGERRTLYLLTEA